MASGFDPETIRLMGLAFEMAIVWLRLVNRGDLAKDVVAHKIFKFAKAGERDPERMCDAVLQQSGCPIAHTAPPIAPGDQL
jgi:hypothetical protein